MGVEGLYVWLLAFGPIYFVDFESPGDYGMNSHKQLNANNTRLADCIKNFLLEMEISNRAPGSMENGGRILRDLLTYAERAGWSDSIYDIDRRCMVEYLAFLKSRPAVNVGVSRPIGDTYYRFCYRQMKSFFNWCFDQEYISDNPLRKIPTPKVAKRVVSTVSVDDFKKLIMVTDPSLLHSPARRFNAVRNQAALWMFFDTPARRNEIARLTLQNVDLKERRILVEGKGRKERYMYLGAVTVRALTLYKSERDALFPGTDDWWVDTQGYSLRDDWLNFMLKRVCARANIPPIHPHQFRHTFSITMIEADVPLPTLEVMGGWAKIPDTYLATLGDRAAKAAHKRVSPADSLLRKR